MRIGLDAPLQGLTYAQRARCALAAWGSLAWVTDSDAGSTPFYDEGGCPMLLTGDDDAAELLAAGSGRVEVDLHPRLGSVRIAGQFWPVIGSEARSTLETVRRQHADCPDCKAAQLTRVIGMQVVTTAIRTPDDREYVPIALDDYLMAQPDPVVVAGAGLALHLNTAHAAELRTLAGGVLDAPPHRIAGAGVGAVDASGFELAITDDSGGHVVTVGFPARPADPRGLADALHDMITGPPAGGLSSVE